MLSLQWKFDDYFEMLTRIFQNKELWFFFKSFHVLLEEGALRSRLIVLKLKPNLSATFHIINSQYQNNMRFYGSK